MRRKRERAELQERLDRLERRMEDLEDLAAVALARDRLEVLAERVEDVTVMAPTHDDLLGVRLHAARLAGDVARQVTELRAELARLATALGDRVSG